MEIKNKKSFNTLVTSLVEEIIEEEELEEMNSTASVGGSYMTPMAFDPEGKNKKKSKKNTYSKKLGESIDSRDLKMIRKLVRDVIANVLRDIWIRRMTWK